MKILINTPRLIPQGGVANHYLGLKNYWKANVVYNPIGKKGNKSGSGIYRLPINIITFIFKILTFKPDIILLNPSLSKSAVIRDMIFLHIAKLMKQKVAIFFHGFDIKSIQHINTRKLTKYLNQCECIFVLANEFAKIIRSWGVTKPIHLTTTKVDDKLIKSFDINTRKGGIKNILFLARVTKEKGIFIAIETFRQIQKTYPYLQFHIVGDGPALNEAKSICTKNNIVNIHFCGILSGEKLIEQYKKADLYLFPTFHAEGMPTSVLEAMAFGLPIITRPVGGLLDFFVDGKMGRLIDSLDPNDFASVIMDYMQKTVEVKRISLFNHEYALKHFMASIVAKKIENELSKYI